MIIGIVCVSANFKEPKKSTWGIGNNNGLLYNLPLDMKHFRTETKNSIVVMGHNTLLSFPNSKPLKNRVNVVLCNKDTNIEGCVCVHSVDDLIALIKPAMNDPEHHIHIIGGGMIYNLMLPYYDKVIVTKVYDSETKATVFFPNLDENKDFSITTKSDIVNDNGYDIQFLEYSRQL